MAMAAAAALDACHFSEIVGCIAGDDTIMCAVRTVPDTIHLMKKLRVFSMIEYRKAGEKCWTVCTSKTSPLIDEEEVTFTEGLNVLSGETGAGKSI